MKFSSINKVGVDIGERDGIQAKFNDGRLESMGNNASEALQKIARRMLNDTLNSMTPGMRAIVQSMGGTVEDVVRILDIYKNGITKTKTQIQEFAELAGNLHNTLSHTVAVQGKWRGAFRGRANTYMLMIYSTRQLEKVVDGLNLTTNAGRKAAIALQELAPAIAQLQDAVIQMTGVTSDAIASIMRDAAQSAQTRREAELNASKGMYKLIYDGILNVFLNSVSQGIMNAIITPLASAAVQTANISVAGAATAANTLAAGGATANSALISGGITTANNLHSGGAAFYEYAKDSGNELVDAVLVARGERPNKKTFMDMVNDPVTGELVSRSELNRRNAIRAAARNSMQNVLTAVRDPAFQSLLKEMSTLMGAIGGELFDFRQLYDPANTTIPKPEIEAPKAEVQNNWDEAYRALERAAGIQRDLAREQLNTAEEIIRVSRSAADELRGVNTAVEAVNFAAAQSSVQQALTVLRSTGHLPDADSYTKAVDALRSGVKSRDYVSAFARDREALGIAATLSEIATLAEPQKTAAERQLEYLDGLLKTAQEQLDALRGNAVVGNLTLQAALDYWRRETGKTLPGFAAGGYTGHGGRLEPAGIVHRGEVVFSQSDVARLGGLDVVERIRRGLPGYADGGAVAVPVMPAPTGSADTRQLAEDLRAMREELARLEDMTAQLSAIAASSNRTTRILERVTRGGDVMVTATEEAQP